MKTRYIIALLLGLFVLSLVFADRSSNIFNTDRLKWMSSLDWAITALGTAIAAISGFRLLHAALNGHKLPQIMPAVIALFAGLTLFQRFWAIPLSFAAIVVCWLIVEYLRPAKKESGD